MDLTYRAYVADEGWQAWVESGAVAGNAGDGKQVEAMQIKLVDAPWGPLICVFLPSPPTMV